MAVNRDILIIQDLNSDYFECDAGGKIVSSCCIPIDLAITKTVDNNTPNVGDTVVFTITGANNGPEDGTGVFINDLLPQGLDYVSDTSGGTYNPNTGINAVGNLANGSNISYTVTARVSSDFPGGVINNVAVIQGDKPELDLSNNSDNAQLTVSVPEVPVPSIIASLDDGTGNNQITTQNIKPDGTAVPCTECAEIKVYRENPITKVRILHETLNGLTGDQASAWTSDIGVPADSVLSYIPTTDILSDCTGVGTVFTLNKKLWADTTGFNSGNAVNLIFESSVGGNCPGSNLTCPVKSSISETTICTVWNFAADNVSLDVGDGSLTNSAGDLTFTESFPTNIDGYRLGGAVFISSNLVNGPTPCGGTTNDLYQVIDGPNLFLTRLKFNGINYSDSVPLSDLGQSNIRAAEIADTLNNSSVWATIAPGSFIDSGVTSLPNGGSYVNCQETVANFTVYKIPACDQPSGALEFDFTNSTGDLATFRFNYANGQGNY